MAPVARELPTMLVVPGSGASGSSSVWSAGPRGSSSSASALQCQVTDLSFGGRPSNGTVRPATNVVPGKTRRRLQFRGMLTQSSWYHSGVAKRLRVFLAGKMFAILMVFALLLALFLPDVWVIVGINSNTSGDALLTIVMGLFTIELLLLSTVDASYLFSFFQLMDVIGTVSMIFDISYMLGTDVTFAPVASDSGEAQKNLMLLRASRAAKIGARAGRLTRVLKILRFLPFLSGNRDEKRTGIASTISGRLANLLATRVACLTILLVMAIPLFDLWTFPQTDGSLRTWVDRISQDIEGNRSQDAVRDLVLMETFYGRYEYWPWMACTGHATDRHGVADFVCDSRVDLSGWQPKRSWPPRNSSTLRVHTRTFMVAFNMHTTIELKSVMAISTIVFILFIMIFSSLALSSVVTELAVRPLERMLDTVRQIASTVFKISAEVGEAEEEETMIENSNEMKLLEKVVQKLAIVADLNTAKRIEATADMRDEDIGILSMMQGKNVVDELRANAQARQSCAVPRKKALIPAPSARLEDFGVSQATYQSWSFNTLPLTRPQRMALAAFTITSFTDSADALCSMQADNQVLQRFIAAVEKEYLPVPFHSFAHAVDVLHSVNRLTQILHAEAFLTELDQYALLVAAIAHDLGHPGVNNGFLAEVGHELALQYNDHSPLENMHCAKLYTLVSNVSMNVFARLSKEQYREARKTCIEVILHTDMMAHGAMVKDLQMTYQMHQEVFNSTDDAPPVNGPSLAAIDVFSAAETKMLILEMILHSADVSNPCRSWDTTYAWAIVCLEEFFAQGDQEKMLGIPVQFLNDRDKLNKPNSQIGFIEFMIAPFFAAQIQLLPVLQELGDNLANNLATWADMWEKEVTPTDAERDKVHARVQKVMDNLQSRAEHEGEK